MPGSLLRDKKLVLLFLFALLLKLFSLREDWVERYYTYGFYPAFSRALRTLFGPVPVSLGDLLYGAAGLLLVVKVWKALRLLSRRQVQEYLSAVLFRRYLKLVLGIYIVFNLFWGLNYNRLGIASQLSLHVQPYSKTELLQLTLLLQQRLNHYAALQDTTARDILSRLPRLQGEAVRDYQKAGAFYPFLAYRRASLKTSLFSPVAHFVGFTGYFNPFTGEAQINGEEPAFLQPFVVNHEMAHQLGYAKENEASFVAYLVGKASASPNFRYSVYYELYGDAFNECRKTGDTAFVNGLRKTLHPRVLRDKEAELQYRLGKRNRVSPYMTDFYDQYLKMNNQPKGMATYSEVLAWLIAYWKKEGAAAI